MCSSACNLWYGLPLWACILVCIGVTLVMYQLTMFLILVCKIPDMLATCALMFVHQGLGQWYIGGGAVSTGMRLPSGASPRAHQAGGFLQRHRPRTLADHHHAGVRADRLHLPGIHQARPLYLRHGRQQAGRQAQRYQREGLPLPGRHDHRGVSSPSAAFWSPPAVLPRR